MNIRELIMDYLQNSSKTALSVEELAIALHLNKSGDFKLFVKTLASLESEHLLHFTSKGKVELEEAKALINGIFRANAAGFGFVTIDVDEPDVFIGKGQTAFALDGDEVFIELDKNANLLKGSAAEGHIVEIVRHELHQIVGTYVAFDEKEKQDTGLIGYVKSRNKKIPYRVYLTDEGLIPENKAIIRAEITHYPDAEFPQSMQGVITEIVGQLGDTGIDVLEVLASMDIVSEFPADVLAQAESIPAEVPESEIVGRVDYREEITFTIDGADAKDLDDAVHAKRLENGNFELGVHIADVSHYVTENSPLDKEAFERGTSVYVTDRVVPMLPERLSNGICSLNPRVNRLTQSCVMEITPDGQVINYQISQSIIKTSERMTYDEVNLMIAGDKETLKKYADIAPSVEIMTDLHHILENMRKKRGAIDFETVEAKIIVDEKGLPVEIKKRSRGVAERMIESFMLEANETVATHFETHGLPFIYRIHEQPKADRLQRFIDFAATFGMQVDTTAGTINQKALQDFLRKVKGQPGEMVLSTMLLRSMQQARYSENNAGHFGLAAENYTHFTSPIRRYPDLLVHRLIREIGFGKIDDKLLQKWEDKIPEIAEHSSHRERRAVDAEREVEKMKKAEFMEEHIGEHFEGVISSVTRFGMFVELPNTIEGLIHISTLKGDYFNYHERMLALVGERTGQIFKIGQLIKIEVVKADKMTGEIDFAYLPSEFDTIDKNVKIKKKPENKRKKSTGKALRVKNVADKKAVSKSKTPVSTDKTVSENKKKKAKKKPFYTKAAKGKFTDKKAVSGRFAEGRKKAHKKY
ncbi:ribonuclease R [Lactococcus allomyrinae]|uniref:Ribonuclease R n=1 Tax=Lactococcus allomyrinae TaxID=2419773 RepID=A0A387BGI3_9LACT|nr:ribonuclease R [Lactococcus allomyrinae]AYG00509.1 ribonuclease R [Lactococcus allomyrinae]